MMMLRRPKCIESIYLFIIEINFISLIRTLFEPHIQLDDQTCMEEEELLQVQLS